MGQQAISRVHRDAMDFLRRLGRDFFDVDAAGGTDNQHRPLRRPIHDDPDVALGGDLRRRRDEDLLYREALDRHPEDGGRRRLGGVRPVRQFDAARFPAAAGVHLRLHDDLAAEALGDPARLGRRRRDVARRHEDAVLSQDVPRLILVQIHACSFAIVVPASPRSAASPWASSAMMARSPPVRTNAAAAAGPQLLAGEQVLRLRQRQPPDGFLVRCAEAAVDSTHVRQDQQHLRADFPAEDCGDAILVGDGVDAFEAQLGVLIDRRSPAASGDHDVAGGRQITHHLLLDNPGRLGTGREPPPVPDRNPPSHEPRLPHRIECMADRFGRRTQIGIVGPTQGLRDQRDDGSPYASASERILQRLLDHVSHPPCCSGDQHPEGQRLDLICRDLVARQFVADLRSVAMDEHDVPPRRREVHDGHETRARMAELIADRRPLTGWRDGVSSERDNDRSRGGDRHGGAT